MLWLALTDVANACTCAPHPDDIREAARAAFLRADVVFVGTAVSARREGSVFNRTGMRITRFRVERIFKGIDGQESVAIRTAQGGFACGIKFSRGARYLVFAHRDFDTNVLTTNLCELNLRAERAGEAIETLDRLLAAPAHDSDSQAPGDARQ